MYNNFTPLMSLDEIDLTNDIIEIYSSENNNNLNKSNSFAKDDNDHIVIHGKKKPLMRLG
jgi:hypothetical protein